MKSQTKTLLTTAGVIAGAYLLLKKKQTVSGIGNIPTYTKSKLETYLNSHLAMELDIDPTDTNSKGYIYVAIADEDGGRGFYVSKENAHWLNRYFRWRLLPVRIYNGHFWDVWNTK